MNASDTSEQTPRKFPWKWILPLALILCVFLPVSLLLGRFFSYRSGNASAVDQLEARVKAKGEPLTLADLAATYPPIPDEENGALALLKIWEQDEPEFWQAFREGELKLPERTYRAVDRGLPFLGSDAQRIGRTMNLDATNVSAANAYLEAEKEHMAAVRTALQFPRFRFPLQITNGFNQLIPHLTELKREAQLFRLEALMAYERGDVDAAITNLEYVVRAGNAVKSEPLLISQLVRVSCYALVTDDVQRMLSRQLTDGQLEKLDGLLNKLQLPGVARFALVSERASLIGTLNLPLSELARAGSEPGESSEEMPEAGYRVGTRLLEASGLRDADRRLLLETMEQAIALAERGDSEALQQYKDLFERVSDEAMRFPPKLFTGMLLPSLGKVPFRFARLEARRRVAKAAVAVERYRLSNGRLPYRLDDLVPQFLAEVPADPMDGKPIRFSALPTGYVVYSIGDDGVDNGGKERPAKGPWKDFDETFVIER